MPAEIFRIRSLPEKDMAVLSVVTDTLDIGQRGEFLTACAELLATDMKWLAVDMRGLRSIFSVFIGSVMDVNTQVRSQERRFTIIASEHLTQMFRSVVGADALEICQPESPEGRSSRRRSSRIVR
jgi:hypothetical protein